MAKKIVSLVFAIIVVAAMTVTVSAETELVPSINLKPAPVPVVQTGEGGQGYVAIIYDAEMKVISKVPREYLFFTPVSATESDPPELLQNLKNAYEQVKAASDLSKLCGDLEAAAKKIAPDANVDELVVRDLFDTTVTDVYAQQLAQAGNTLCIRFDADVAKNLVAVLHNVEGETWDTGEIKKNADGTVDIFLSDSGPVAFLISGQPGPATKTGDAGVALFAVLAVISCAAALFLRKKA